MLRNTDCLAGAVAVAAVTGTKPTTNQTETSLPTGFLAYLLQFPPTYLI